VLLVKWSAVGSVAVPHCAVHRLLLGYWCICLKPSPPLCCLTPLPCPFCCPQTLKELQKEAEVMASLRHPNIVLFMGICLEPPCVVTEFCVHGSLFDVLAKVRDGEGWRCAALLGLLHPIPSPCATHCLPGRSNIRWLRAM
jgi:hypothetical protein